MALKLFCTIFLKYKAHLKAVLKIIFHIKIVKITTLNYSFYDSK